MKVGSQRVIFIPKFTAALFTIAKKWKHPKCPLKDERINKTRYIHKIEYDSALKTREILTHVTI